MSHIRSPFAALCRPNSLSLRHKSNLSTTNSHFNQTSEQKIYSHFLKACQRIRIRHPLDELAQRPAQALRTSKTIHAQTLKFGFGSKGRLGDAIVDLYSKCGDTEFALKAFNHLEEPDILAWNSVLSLYSRQGPVEKVIRCFGSLQNCGVLPNQFTYAIVLSSCARLVDIYLGKQVHGGVIKMGFEFNSFCEGSLINMYSKCGSLVDARRIYDAVAKPDTVSWTAMIAAYVQVGLPEEALKMFEDMQKIDLVPDQVAFVTLITACVGLGRLDDACDLFAQMPNPNVVAWNVIISGHAKRGCDIEAINFFQNMRKTGIKSTRSTLGSVLSAIASLEALNYGLLVHAQAIKQGLNCNVYVGSSLISMYAKCEKMESAKKVFDSVDERNLVLWNAMLGGYAQNGNASEVLKLFSEMRSCGFQPDDFSYTSILSACACLECLQMGCQLHAFIIKHNFECNIFVENALVDMYAKCGALDEARQQFESIRNRDSVSWNAIIGGYVHEGKEDEAFNMFQMMNLDGITPDEASLACILSACSNLQTLKQGELVHCFLVKSGLQTSLYAGSSLIDMYVKCGSIEAAQNVFASMPNRSVVSMNALIAGYAQHDLDEAIDLFHEMQNGGLTPSKITFSSLLDACNGPAKLNLGRQIHCLILKRGLLFGDDLLGVSLLAMYMNSQRKTDADILFSEFQHPKSTILCTAIISSHTQNGYSEEALQFYGEMRRYNGIPDQATFASVLKACSILASLGNGRVIHSLIFHIGFDSDELTCSALVDMYAKCGDMRSSVQVFEEMGCKNDVISWNSMIFGFAKNGFAEKALKIFEEMKQEQVRPDDVTFLGVLTACSHAGRVTEGREIFDIMVNTYKIIPRVDHYACMIDLLGRWGFLEEAEEFIDKLKFEPDAMIWATLLGACRIHGDDIRARRAAEKLMELEPENSSSYVLLSNIHAASGNWDEVNSVRRTMREKGVRKFPGCSWIVVGQETNLFVAGDTFHPRSSEIHAVLKDLISLMKQDGYVAETDSLLMDED